MNITSDRIVSWVIPCLLSAGIGVGSWIGVNISRISETLAVAVYRIELHEKRLDQIDYWRSHLAPRKR